MEHYSTAGKFPDSIGDYTDLKVVCETNAVLTVLYVLIGTFFFLCMFACMWYLCKVPQSRISKTIAPENVEFRAKKLELKNN